jgi:PAS domain S-box-containing protein
MENSFPVINVAVIIILFGLTWWYAKSTSNLLRQSQEQVAAIQNQALTKTQELQKSYAQVIQEIETRRQVEERLKKSEARFAAFMRHLPGSAVMRDVNGRYLFANETWQEVFGQGPEDWFDENLEEVRSPDPGSRLSETEQKVLQGGQPLESVETVERDDGPHYWLTKRFPIPGRDDQDCMIGAIGIDITDRRQAEEALSREKERYRILVEETPLGISIISKSGHYKYVNSAFVQMLGYTLAEVPHGRAWFARAFPDPEYRQQAISAWKNDLLASQSGPPRPRIFRVTCKNGFEKVINFRVVSLSTGDRFVIYEDITARHRAQEELRQSEFKYRLLINQIPAIAFKGYSDWSVDFFDDKIETLTGYPKAFFDSRQLRWRDLIPPEDLEEVQKIFLDALRTNKSYVLEHRLRKKNGEFAWVQCRGQIFCDAEENVDYISGVTFDITERKQAEEALRRREAILEAVGFAAGRFLQSASWEENIQEILARLGQAVAASRAYIFENSPQADGQLLTGQRYEWVASTLTPRDDYPPLQKLSWQGSGFDRWQDELSRNHLIAGQVKDFPPEEQEFLRARDIDSILLVPIFTGQQWWGVIGFDECLQEREWSLAELEALKAAASTLGAAIQHERDGTALKGSEKKLRSLSCQLLDAQENERKRLAAELHDELGHALLTLKLRLESLENRLQPEQEGLKKETQQILGFLLATIEGVRRLYLDLSPGDLEDLGLTNALDALIGDFAALQTGIKWVVHLEKLDGLFPLSVQTAIYRVVQEALTNIGKHAQPREISLAIKKEVKQVSFTIADNGKGFDISQVFNAKKTLGLLAMEERVKILGGAFELWSQPDQGTRVSFTIPLEEGRT